MKGYNKLMAYITVIVTSLLFSECTLNEDLTNLKSSVSDLKLFIGTPEFKTGVHLDFIDAKTNAYITGKALVKISGKDASIIYNNLGEARNSEHQTMNGMLSLIVDPHKVDAFTIGKNPVKFDIIVSLPGYAGVTRSITIQEYKTINIIVPLVKLDDTPEGVTVIENTSFASSSSTGAVQTTSVETLNSGNQTVEVQQNVVLQDESGKPVTGVIQSQVIFYDPTSTAAQNAIPGGTSVTATLENGKTQETKLESAGLFDISLKAGDAHVKKFSNGGLKIKTVLSPSLINPITKQTIKAGDEIALWSKQENTGRWIFEKMDIIKNEGGELILEETVTHLSYWNWAWTGTILAEGPKITWKGESMGESVKVSNETGSVITYAKPNDANDGIYQLRNFADVTGTGKTVLLKFSSPMDVSTFSPSSILINAVNQTSNFNVIISRKPSVLELKLKFSASVQKSANGTPGASISPSFNLNIKPKNSAATDLFTTIPFVSGVGHLNLNLGTEYALNISIGTVTLDGTIKIEEEGSNLKLTAIQNSEPTKPYYYTVPKPADNKIEAKYDISVSQDEMNLLNP